MWKKSFRWPFFLILAVLVLAAFVPLLSLFHASKLTGAHAAGTPTITVSGSIFYPSQALSVTGSGFAANDKVAIMLDDVAYGPSLGMLSCDSSGDCSGKAKLPQYPGVEGQHTLYGLGTVQAGEIAQTPITIDPRLYPVSGGPNAQVLLVGSAFFAGEPVNIYWGSASGQLIASVTTSSYGSIGLQMAVPAGLTPGSYKITAVRSNQKPSQVVTTFVLLPPKITAPAGIHDGQTVNVHLSGFQANEQVAVSWNASGGQQLATINVDGSGAVKSTLSFPFVPVGSYKLTAQGKTSGLQATSNVKIGPGIELTPNTANPGATISVSGGGYTAGETVSVYFQTVTNGEVSTTVDTTGQFTVSLTVPMTYQKGTSYSVHAINAAGTEHASTPFSFIKPWLTLYGRPVFGQSTMYRGAGFGANETVALWCNYGLPYQLQVGTTTAGSDGTISGSIIIASSPYQTTTSSDPLGVSAIGNSSAVSAEDTTTESASFTITPSWPAIGSTIQINGGGYGAAETVSISFGSTTVATTSTDASGAFTSSYVLPTSMSPSKVTVTIKGNTSGISIWTSLVVTPALSITPTSGPSGTTITVKGSYFTANNTAQIYWFDPSSRNLILLATVPTSSTGTFKTTVMAPANLSSGATYQVTGNDAATEIAVAVSFVAQ